MRTFWARVGCIVKGFAGWVVLCVERRGGGGLGDEVEMLAIDAAALVGEARAGGLANRRASIGRLAVLEIRDNIFVVLIWVLCRIQPQFIEVHVNCTMTWNENDSVANCISCTIHDQVVPPPEIMTVSVVQAKDEHEGISNRHRSMFLALE